MSKETARLWYLHSEIALRIQEAEYLGLYDVAAELKKALELTAKKLQDGQPNPRME